MLNYNRAYGAVQYLASFCFMLLITCMNTNALFSFSPTYIYKYFIFSNSLLLYLKNYLVNYLIYGVKKFGSLNLWPLRYDSLICLLTTLIVLHLNLRLTRILT